MPSPRIFPFRTICMYMNAAYNGRVEVRTLQRRLVRTSTRRGGGVAAGIRHSWTPGVMRAEGNPDIPTAGANSGLLTRKLWHRCWHN